MDRSISQSFATDTKGHTSKSRAIYYGDGHAENPDLSLGNFRSNRYTKESRILDADDSEIINLESDFDKLSAEFEVRKVSHSPNDEIESINNVGHTSQNNSSIFSK